MGKKVKQTNVAKVDMRKELATPWQDHGLVSKLTAQMNGQGPSLAQAQLQQGTDQNIAQQMAMAASARGGSLGMAQRQAAMNAAGVQQQMAGQSGILRLQEQQQAQQQLAQLIGQRDQTRQGLIGLANQRDATNVTAQANSKNFVEGAAPIIAGLGQAAAAGAMASDERVKTDVKPAGKKIESFLDALGAHEYEYKGEAKKSALGGEGKHVSPMAQELEKTELGKGMVEDTAGGKVVDYGKGFGVMLATMKEMHERLKKIEGKKKNG